MIFTRCLDKLFGNTIGFRFSYQKLTNNSTNQPKLPIAIFLNKFYQFSVQLNQNGYAIPTVLNNALKKKNHKNIIIKMTLSIYNNLKNLWGKKNEKKVQ